MYLHFTFILLLAIVGATEGWASGSLTAALLGILFFISLFACVLAHEFGHILMARRFGIGTRDVTLLPIGGVARLEKIPEKPKQELWVALAGPAVNVVIALILFIWITLFGDGLDSIRLSLVHGGFAVQLMTINLIMIAFNLLPAFPMDGGRVLRAFLATRMEFTKATKIAAFFGRTMAVIFVVTGLFLLKNPFLFFIALMVWFGAGQEAKQAEIKSNLREVLVRHAMIREFHTAQAEDPLSKIADWILAGSQTDFPVVNHSGELIGMISIHDLFESLRKHDPSTPARLVMRSDYEEVGPDQWLEPSLMRFQEDPVITIPVVEGGCVVGLLTMENISELVKIRQALLQRLESARSI